MAKIIGRPMCGERKKEIMSRIKFDDCDKPLVDSGYWNITTNGYVRGRINGSRKLIFLHREIIKCPNGLMVDHINGDKLDNRRDNLRIVNRSQNSMNSVKPKNGKSTCEYKGVLKKKNYSGWHARIRIPSPNGTRGKQVTLGMYPCPTLAAMAYDSASRKYFGEYAKPNFSGAKK